MRVLMIDDDLELGQALKPMLRKYGIALEQAETPCYGMQILRNDCPDVLLLDMILPEKDGMEVCRDIRASDDSLSRLPIIAFSVRSELMDRVVGLEGGVDDYIAKPCEIRELVARLRAISRLAGLRAPADAPRLEFLELHPARFEASFAGARIAVTELEMSLLACLDDQRGQVLSRRLILGGIGHDPDGDPSLIDTLVYRIRQKFRATGIPRDLIQTVWGEGYRLRDGMAG